MSKNLAIRKNVLAKRKTSSMSFGTIIGIVVIGLIIYLILKNRTSSTSGTYQNTKKWLIKYNEDGLPTEITKVVNAKVV